MLMRTTRRTFLVGISQDTRTFFRNIASIVSLSVLFCSSLHSPRNLVHKLSTHKLSTMPDYPGLGLPLRHNPQMDYGHYPIGAHGSCSGAKSDIIMIRELAMMSIMERLTDKENWEKKVFDDDIVSKWREEALAIPDSELADLASSSKRQYWDDDGKVHVKDDWRLDDANPLKGIMNTNTFDCVRFSCFVVS